MPFVQPVNSKVPFGRISFLYRVAISAETWLQIGRGDQTAYARAYRFFYSRFYNYGCKFTGDEYLLEDAIQETLLEIWNQRHRLPSLAHPSTYFYASFRYILFQKLKAQRRLVSGSELPVEPAFATDQILVSREADEALKAQLQQALQSLTPRQREAIFLRFYEGLSYEEVAAVLKITVKATYKIMARALQQLREAMPAGVLLMVLRPFFGPGGGM